MSTKLEEIQKRIIGEDIKVVSFDIFDTLLVRPVCSPTELFKIVGARSGIEKRKFQIIRKNAEQEARKCKPFNIDDITLDDIYLQLVQKFGFSQEEANRIKKIELAVEEAYLYRRESVGQLFQAAKEAEKEVIIVSDMYLPKSFLEKVLKKNSYVGYSHLYLSCEYKASKGTGKLYQCVLEDYERKGIKSNEIIHIGDNSQADIRQAARFGIQTAYIPSVMSVFKSKKMFGDLINGMHPATDNTFLIGYLANKLFDDGFLPFNSESIINGTTKNIGNILAPFLLAFTKWLLEEVKVNDVDTLVLAYRDGYLIEKMIEIFRKYDLVPAVKRAYLSRKVRMDYLLSEGGNLLASIVDFPPNPMMTVEKFIDTRMVVRDEEKARKVLDVFLQNGYTSEKNEIGDMSSYIRFIDALEPFVGDSKMKSDITRYCSETFRGSNKVAIFDVGYRGSVSRFLNDKMGISNIGYHLLASSLIDVNHAKDYNLKSYIYYGMSTPKETVILHALIEDILCSQEGSVSGVRYKDDELELLRENYHEQKQIEEIQKTILDYATGFLELFHQDIWNLEFDHYLEFDLLLKLLKSPSKMDASVIGELSFCDSQFIGREDNVYLEWRNRHYPTINGKITVIKSKKELLIKALEKMHLKSLALKIYHFMKQFYKHSERWSIKHGYSWESIMQEMRESVEEIVSQEMLLNKKNIVIVGDMVSFDKGVCRYLNMLSEKLFQKGYNFILLSEAVLAPDSVLRKRVNFSAFKVPTVLGKNQYEKNCKINISHELEKKIKETSYLSWSVDNWSMRHSDMEESYAKMLAGIAESYYSQVFDYLKPLKIIMWNQFHALHHIVDGIAKERNIPVFYMEFGSIPGTFAFEAIGQMGESYPAVRYREFFNLTVTEEEFQEAGEIWRYLKESKLNRNIQNTSDGAKKLLNTLDKSRPIILFAGQNDFESGLCPYDEHTKKYHSPIFKSSYEAVIHLADLAKKNNWTLIYKPHPIMASLGSESKRLPSNVVMVSDIDINEVIDFADVTVTILSQTGYISTIRKKATVMLGYTQLKGKECTYEAFHKEEVEVVLSDAIEKGFQPAQEVAFQKHIAQMMKYYLYDDNLDRTLSYGQSIEEVVNKISS